MKKSVVLLIATTLLSSFFLLAIFFFGSSKERVSLPYPGDPEVLKSKYTQLPIRTEREKLIEAFNSLEKNRCKEAIASFRALESMSLEQGIRSEIIPYRIWCEQLVARGASADTLGGIIRGTIARLGWLIWPLFGVVFLGWSYSIFGLIKIFKFPRY
jgi:hypothetical protein